MKKIKNPETGKINTELLTLGIQIKPETWGRNGGAGPAEGMTLLIKEVPLNVSVNSSYAKNSCYTADKKKCGFMLFKENKPLFPIDVVPRPKFYNGKTENGVSYEKIALLHGKDCLATTVFQTCSYWNSKKRCRFCGIELSLKSLRTIAVKTPCQLSEVAQSAKLKDNISHVVITTGCINSFANLVSHIADCVLAIKASTKLPVHVQIEPPEDLVLLKELKEAGLDTIGLHIESFDENVLKKIAPVKFEYGLKRYEKAWEKSVELFGKNQVSSFLIAGLGERHESLIKGAEYLSRLGVYPFVVPLRPIPGSLMANAKPPEPSYMINIYQSVSSILSRYKLSSEKTKAGCVRCGACSALSQFEV